MSWRLYNSIKNSKYDELQKILNEEQFEYFQIYLSLESCIQKQDLKAFSLLLRYDNFLETFLDDHAKLIKILVELEIDILYYPFSQNLISIRDIFISEENLDVFNIEENAENEIKFVMACREGNLEVVEELIYQVGELNIEIKVLIIKNTSNLEIIQFLINHGYDFIDKIYETDLGDIQLFLYEYYQNRFDQYDLGMLFINLISKRNLTILIMIMKRLDFDIHLDMDIIETGIRDPFFAPIREFLEKYPTHEIKVRNLPLDESIQDLNKVILNLSETSESLPQSISQMVTDTVIENLRFQIQELESLRI